MTEQYISERTARIITNVVWAAYAAAVALSWFFPLFGVILLTFIFVLDVLMHFVIEPRLKGRDDDDQFTSVGQDYEEFK